MEYERETLVEILGLIKQLKPEIVNKRQTVIIKWQPQKTNYLLKLE